MEQACRRALDLGAYNYRSVKSSLRGTEKVPPDGQKMIIPLHANVRGRTTTGRRIMIEATVEQLYLMKLFGMAEGLREQMNGPEYRDLAFEERRAFLSTKKGCTGRTAG
jgi:hypothetical protein